MGCQNLRIPRPQMGYRIANGTVSFHCTQLPAAAEAMVRNPATSPDKVWTGGRQRHLRYE